MRTIKFHTREMHTCNYELLETDDYGNVYGWIRDWNGNRVARFKALNESQKGLTVETSYLTGEPITIYLPNADWHTLQTKDEGYTEYLKRRREHWNIEFGKYLNE